MAERLVSTRRSTLLGLAGFLGGTNFIPPVSVAHAIAHPDAELIALGEQFDDIAAQIDFAIDNTGPGQSYYQSAMETAFDEYRMIHPRIMALTATTIEGFKVKARVARWSSADKMSPDDGCVFADVMALSLVRDVLDLQRYPDQA